MKNSKKTVKAAKIDNYYEASNFSYGDFQPLPIYQFPDADLQARALPVYLADGISKI